MSQIINIPPNNIITTNSSPVSSSSPSPSQSSLVSQYFIKTLTGKHITSIEIDSMKFTGKQIKQIIAEKENLNPNQMRLCVTGVNWQDDETLFELSNRTQINLWESNVMVLRISKNAASSNIGNVTAKEFVECVNLKRFEGFTPLLEKEVKRAIELGILFNIVTDEKMQDSPIAISRESKVITACTSGVNRSQVAERVAAQMGLTTLGILAADTAMNLEADFPNFAETDNDRYGAATNFKICFGSNKKPQIGANELASFAETDQELIDARNFYKTYIKNLEAPIHFIAFGQSVIPIIRRLLERGESRGFAITYVPWKDEVNYPAEGVARCSVEAYKQFTDKLKNCFKIV